jgi:hypothetical protein
VAGFQVIKSGRFSVITEVERVSAAEARAFAKDVARQAKVDAKAFAARSAAQQVEQYESYVKMLLSIHKHCGDAWDWQEVTVEPAPVAPEPTRQHEQPAAAALTAYTPGFFAKLLGGAKAKRAALEADVEYARSMDIVANDAAKVAHQGAVI